ncbi:MAG: Na+/H+ antiporter subunit E [Planctomycetota bacterium]|jgi:multicomponent Na+:H+ antiporter subunit E
MKWFLCLIAVLALWILLFWSVSLAVLVVGAIFALLVATLLGDIYPDGLLMVLNPVRWLYFLIYLPYFLYYCIRANLDVALRVIHPDVPIEPGIVKVRTTLTSDMAKTFLANSITLTPGTLTIDIDGQDLYIHWINIHTEDAAKRTAEICERFEPLLRRIFE